MKNFTYYQPKTPREAVGLLGDAWGNAELLAGGTDLLDMMKEYVAQPDKVVALNGIGADGFSNMAVLQKEPPIFQLGAGMRLADVAESPILQKHCPALTEAAGLIGGPQIRNMGTLGGNLCQRNRCWYFRDEEVVCLLKGGKKCYATDGENRYHAVFVQGHPCVIVNPSTLAPALIALGATAQVLGPRGTRQLELATFFKAPSKGGEREHVLAPNEIVLSVTIPAVNGGRNASYEVRHKQAYDWPLVQAAVAFKQEGTKVSGVRIVLGHVAPTPHVAKEAAELLEGRELTEGAAAEAGHAATKGAKPLSQNGYKLKLIEVAVKRALLTAAGQKKYWEV